MMQKRILSLLLAGLLLAGVLGGCAGGNGESGSSLPIEESVSEEPEVVEIEDPDEIPETPDPEPMAMTLEEAQALLVADETGVVPIESAEQLVALSVLVGSGDTGHRDVTYVMQRNIDVSTMAFPPIGGGDFAEDMPTFGGTFDGGNYLLSGVTVTLGVANTVGNGFFGAVGPQGSVRNLHLTAASVKGHNATGGVVGYCAGSLYNCSVAGEVTSTGGRIGGLCGELAAGGAVTGCFSNVQTGGNAEVGGFIGATGAESKVSDCYAMGRVTAIDSPFTDGPARIGGFIGTQNGGEVHSCYSYIEVYTQVAARVVGGFIGYNDGALVNCYYNQEATSNWKDIDANVDEELYQVTGCTVEEMLEQETYAGWDFVNTWDMLPGRARGLPHLRAAWDD